MGQTQRVGENEGGSLEVLTMNDTECTCDSTEEALNNIRETLSLDEGDTITDAIESLQSTVDAYQREEIEDLRQTVLDHSAYEIDDIEGWDIERLQMFTDMMDHVGVSEEGEPTTDEGTVKTPTTEPASKTERPNGSFNPMKVYGE